MSEETVKLKKLQSLPIVDPLNPSKKFSEKEEKWLREMSTYEFFNLEEPGLMMKCSYGNTKNHTKLTFFHGAKYQLPRFIARHVESKGTPIYKWMPDGRGGMHKEKIGIKTRFQLREVFDVV